MFYIGEGNDPVPRNARYFREKKRGSCRINIAAKSRPVRYFYKRHECLTRGRINRFTILSLLHVERLHLTSF